MTTQVEVRPVVFRSAFCGVQRVSMPFRRLQSVRIRGDWVDAQVCKQEGLPLGGGCRVGLDG